jgi:hypothetical protein
MVSDNEAAPEDVEANAAPNELVRQRRERSEVGFPYADLGQALDLARVLHQRGGGAAEREQLAGWMDQSATGGTFRSRLSAATMFGLVEVDRAHVRITPRGREAVDGQVGALADAFLQVELFRAMFDRHSGYALPPPAAVERQMVELGVPSKQKERARQTFQKSATIAGFVDPVTGRLVKPAVRREQEGPAPAPHDSQRNVGGGGGGRGPDEPYHPFIMGLLNELPAAPDFPKWSIEEQAEWLRTAAGIFKLMSKQSGRIVVEVKNADPGRQAGVHEVAGGGANSSETD